MGCKDGLADADIAICSRQFTDETSIDIASIEADGIIGLTTGTGASRKDKLQITHFCRSERDVLLCLIADILLMRQERPILACLGTAIHPILGHIAAVRLPALHIAKDKAVHFVDASELQHHPRLRSTGIAPLTPGIDVAGVHIVRAFTLVSITATGVHKAGHLARTER